MFIKIDELAIALDYNYCVDDSRKAYLDPDTGEIIYDNEDRAKLPDSERSKWIDLPDIPYLDMAYDFLDIGFHPKEKKLFIENMIQTNNHRLLQKHFETEMYKTRYWQRWFRYYSERLVEYAQNWCCENNYKFTDKYYRMYYQNAVCGLFTDFYDNQAWR